jgi:hypothetical protein
MIEKHFDGRSDEAIISALTHDPGAYPMALGCAPCPQRRVCGGLCIKAPILDCLGFCCGAPDSCTRVCRNRPGRFVDQVREIDGFALDNIERAPVIECGIEADIVPLIYHGSRRVRALRNDVFALPLPELVNFREARLRYPDRASLCEAFRIPLDARLILSGVNLDHRIEPWWKLAERRKPIIDDMRRIGIDLVTAPNFSAVLDQPRTDDMHAMKRIGIVFAEFANGGIACALHPNGRTERDFERWGVFIAERDEVTTLSYEFITGPGRNARRPWHLARLADLSHQAGRDLDIIVRGDPRVIPFRHVIYIETTSFMKTLNRQRGERVGNNRLHFATAATGPDESVDDLFVHNLQERIALLRALYYGDRPLPTAAE